MNYMLMKASQYCRRKCGVSILYICVQWVILSP